MVRLVNCILNEGIVCMYQTYSLAKIIRNCQLIFSHKIVAFRLFIDGYNFYTISSSIYCCSGYAETGLLQQCGWSSVGGNNLRKRDQLGTSYPACPYGLRHTYPHSLRTYRLQSFTSTGFQQISVLYSCICCSINMSLKRTRSNELSTNGSHANDDHRNVKQKLLHASSSPSSVSEKVSIVTFWQVGDIYIYNYICS